MDVEERLAQLEAESMVLQMLLSGLCQRLRRDPAGDAMVKNAFDYAEQVLSVGALKIGGQGIADREQILQELRRTVFQDHHEPKGGV